MLLCYTVVDKTSGSYMYMFNACVLASYTWNIDNGFLILHF